MDKLKPALFGVTLGFILVTAGLLGYLRTHQRLGRPGILTKEIPNSPRRELLLPELVLDYKSEVTDLDPNLMLYMPQDSSFMQRRYTAPDGFQTVINEVLMGADRSTIHKPQFCLRGAGWNIDESRSIETTIHMQHPQPYDLPVMKLWCTREVAMNGKTMTVNGVYVYWFVADGQLTARHSTRMWSMAKELLLTGTLQRWAYITCFSACRPGDEDATYARMVKFIQASVPEFQLFPAPPGPVAGAVRAASS